MNTIKFLIMATLAVAPAAVIAAESPAQGQSLTDEQKAKIAEIQKYVKAQEEFINERYADRIAAFKDEKQTQLLPLEIGDNHKFVQTGFVGWAEYIDEVLRLNGVDLRNDREYMDTFENFRSNLLPAVKKFDQTPKLLAIAERRLADEQNLVRQRFSSEQFAIEQVQAEKEKRYALEVQLPEFEKQLTSNVLYSPKPAPAGMVTGIVYSKDNPAAIVGSQIVHKDAKMGNVRVIAITPDGVEFEKAGTHWTQKVGDTPGTQW